MKVVPLYDRLLVKRVEAEEKSKGGIILPDSAKEKPKEGEVISVGKGKINDKGERVALTVKEGDKILFSSYAGTEIKVDGEDFLIMREEDILAVIE
ncbi:co-chaperone GroES [bacterium]|nr:co-chaperone GroES [bacterium]